jgi:hypothetical protein
MDRREFEEYFKEILDLIEVEYKKTEEFEKIIDAEIRKFTEYVSSKGGQHYLIEHIQNSISLSSQKQSLIKDKFTVKKAILDYTLKAKGDDGTEKNIFAEIAKLIEKEKGKTVVKPHIEESNVDSQIDEILESSEDED